MDFLDDPRPEPERLRVRIDDAEDPDAVPNPESEDLAQLVPQALPVGCLNVEPNRAIRPTVEPVRVICHTRVVARTFRSKGEGTLEPENVRRMAELVEVADVRVGRHPD